MDDEFGLDYEEPALTTQSPDAQAKKTPQRLLRDAAIARATSDKAFAMSGKSELGHGSGF